MTIERRTDHLWGILKGEAKALCTGSFVEWEIANRDNLSITQSIEVKTPDIITVRTMYPGRASVTSLYQHEINNNTVLYARKVTLREALTGKVEKVVWREDEPLEGTKTFNPKLRLAV